MSEFKWEVRYVVFKIKDLKRHSIESLGVIEWIGRKISLGRKREGRPPFNAVVVEQDWPEFDAVQDSIEARMSDGAIICRRCGHATTGPEVRQRVVHTDHCYECAEAGRRGSFFKILNLGPSGPTPKAALPNWFPDALGSVDDARKLERLTSDPTDPRLGHGADETPVPQNEAYLVLSEEERAKGFVRPLRRAYRHVGIRPKFPTRQLTIDEQIAYPDSDYVCYEAYPESEAPKIGKFWTKSELKSGCGGVTTMGLALCETYARDPKFYGSTYCTGCSMHKRVEEFVWVEDGKVVGS